MVSIRTFSASVLCTAALAGCVTEGKDFNSETAWIKEKRNSQADVKNILKEPYSVGASAGKPTWTYGYYRYKLIGPSHQKELKFYWSPDGTVDSFSFNSNFPEDTGRSDKS